MYPQHQQPQRSLPAASALCDCNISTRVLAAPTASAQLACSISNPVLQLNPVLSARRLFFLSLTAAGGVDS
eukprot:scaffold100232_cov15-Tisochrysis_lutea.AAC.1